MMSVSRLTRSPTFRSASTVTDTVWGMAEMAKDWRSTLATVRLMPSMVMEPFSTTYRRISGPAAMVYQMALSSRVIRCTVPTPSTWPATMWPPKRPFAAMARSRLTRLPGRRVARAERFKVSCMTSAVKPVGE